MRRRAVPENSRYDEQDRDEKIDLLLEKSREYEALAKVVAAAKEYVERKKKGFWSKFCSTLTQDDRDVIQCAMPERRVYVRGQKPRRRARPENGDFGSGCYVLPVIRDDYDLKYLLNSEFDELNDAFGRGIGDLRCVLRQLRHSMGENNLSWSSFMKTIPAPQADLYYADADESEPELDKNGDGSDSSDYGEGEDEDENDDDDDDDDEEDSAAAPAPATTAASAATKPDAIHEAKKLKR